MATRKNKTSFFCTSCGYQSAKWMGKCPACNEWETMREAPADDKPEDDHKTPEMIIALNELGDETRPLPLSQIDDAEQPRQETGIGEFDRVLGGGVVTGSVVLVGGDPGIGKSTLLLQVLDRLSSPGQVTLYVSGEESPGQSKMRGQRMNIDNDNLYFLSASSCEEIIKNFRQLKPKALVIDSIQTCHSPEVKSPPGSTSQIRQTAAHLVKIAKLTNTPTFIIGHVT
ncbi:MAG TPA: DNA repair protein RadA, partial [Desulfarculaceae bacterium]|nr:DNA repair protein RadA [Desulfarculaceae bacterium]